MFDLSNINTSPPLTGTHELSHVLWGTGNQGTRNLQGLQIKLGETRGTPKLYGCTLGCASGNQVGVILRSKHEVLAHRYVKAKSSYKPSELSG